MPNRSIEEDIALSSSLDILITAYQKVSVNRMQNTRKQVLMARKFNEELATVYADVRTSQYYSARKQISRFFFKKQTINKNNFNQEPLALMISSNNRLDGGIAQQVFRRFAKYVEKKPQANIIITGQVGASLFKQRFPDKKFEYIELPKHEITEEDLAPLVELTQKYLDVKIFYGKFINLIDQEPTVATLSDEELIASQHKKTKAYTKQEYTSFIYEPSLKEIIKFFDTQILSSLLARTTQEGNLAEHGSRVTAMEQARQNVDRLLQELKQEAMSNQKEEKNKKQREQFASLQLWQNG